MRKSSCLRRKWFFLLLDILEGKYKCVYLFRMIEHKVKVRISRLMKPQRKEMKLSSREKLKTPLIVVP